MNLQETITKKVDPRNSYKILQKKQVNGEIILLPDVDDVMLVTIPICHESRWYKITGNYKAIVKKLQGKIVEVSGIVENPDDFVDTLQIEEIISILPRLSNLNGSVSQKDEDEIILTELSN